MRNLFLITTLFILFISCEKKQQSCYSSFTYFKGNIRLNYLLKFNSSDTVYFFDRYPLGKQGTYYFILGEKAKKDLDSIVCGFRFPKDSVIVNNGIEDGTTIAFSINNRRLMLHGHKGPKEFWNFEKWIDSIQFYNPLKPINRKVKFENFDDMIYIPDTITATNSRLAQ